ncbi:MAG TPA: permease, partial [bacterium]|nr:permease [bacterium]
MEPTPAAAGSYRTKLWITVAVIAVLVLVNKWMAGELGQITRPLGHPKVQLFTIMLLAILLEGFPFLLAGSFVSGALEVLVPPAFLEERVFPRQKLPAAAVGSLLGLIFPVCSCGNIPVARRLLHKGVPVAGVVAYLLAAPIINPV